MSKNLKSKNKKKGFTLIELIIVVAIMAILAAIAIPKFGNIKENASIKSDIVNAKNIQTAVVALLGEGKIENGSKFEVNDVETNGKHVIGYLQNTPKLEASSNKKELFYVVVGDNGDVSIKVKNQNGPEIYPKGTGIYEEK